MKTEYIWIDEQITDTIYFHLFHLNLNLKNIFKNSWKRVK